MKASRSNAAAMPWCQQPCSGCVVVGVAHLCFYNPNAAIQCERKTNKQCENHP